LMREARAQILAGTYETWKADLLKRWEANAAGVKT